MTPAPVEAIGLSDAGSVRQYNEDRIVLAPDIGVVALADGMGGHRAGDLASQLAADLVVNGLRSQLGNTGTTQAQHSPLLAVDLSINHANQTIFNAAQASVAHEGMGTTLAVAMFHAGGVAIAHVGDSRIYRLRAGRLALLTRDDSLIRQQVEAGLIGAGDVADSHNRSLVTQALGVAEHVDAHVRDVDRLPGDVFVLCSDGLSDLVEHDDIELIVDSLRANLPLAARTLVETAKDNGGYDNVSVILARAGAEAANGSTGWLARVRGWLFGSAH